MGRINLQEWDPPLDPMCQVRNPNTFLLQLYIKYIYNFMLMWDSEYNLHRHVRGPHDLFKPSNHPNGINLSFKIDWWYSERFGDCETNMFGIYGGPSIKAYLIVLCYFLRGKYYLIGKYSLYSRINFFL